MALEPNCMNALINKSTALYSIDKFEDCINCADQALKNDQNSLLA